MLKKALGTAAAAVAVLAVTTAPASADEYWKPHHRSSGNANSSKCYVPGLQGSMPMCLFWHNTGTQAVWAQEEAPTTWPARGSARTPEPAPVRT